MERKRLQTENALIKIVRGLNNMIEKILQYLNSRPDKVMHFAVGYISATLFPTLPVYGLLVALIIGKAKEMYDAKHQDKHTYDKWDMFATWMGGVLGFIAMVIK